MKRDRSPYKSDKTPEISAAEYRELMGLDTPNAVPKPVRKNKFNAVSSKSRDGKTHASKFERQVYETLCLWANQGWIMIVGLQSNVRLGPDTNWKVDFQIFDRRTLQYEWHEAKGMRDHKGLGDDNFRKNYKLWQKYQPGILKVWGGDWKNPQIIDAMTIIPKNMEAK